jgi:hypothetical protein
MIPKNELRVGNYVSAGQLGFVTVSEVTSKTEELSSPITITHEILEKCGFEKTKYEHKIEAGTYGTIYYKNGVTSLHYAIGWESEEEEVSHIKYLHQLQNLYFALTGEELNINL